SMIAARSASGISDPSNARGDQRSRKMRSSLVSVVRAVILFSLDWRITPFQMVTERAERHPRKSCPPEGSASPVDRTAAADGGNAPLVRDEQRHGRSGKEGAARSAEELLAQAAVTVAPRH